MRSIANGSITHGARAALLASCVLMLGACQQINREVAPSVPTDYRQRHPIAIREGDRTLEVFVGANRGTLLPGQGADVMAFAGTWRREGTGGIVVEVPEGTPNERAAHDVLREVRSLLGAAGVPAHGVVIRHYRPTTPAQLATVKLSYPRLAAETGPCGLWPHDLGVTAAPEHARNRPYWNLGCASQRNLAAMVENPADLVQPRPEAPIFAARRSTVIDKYRKGESTATVYTNPDKGAISDVGK